MFFAHTGLWLTLAPLLALPVIIHLLNQKFPRQLAFSSVELIRRSIARRSKLFRWRHLLLALLRTAVLALLLAAFLKPIQAMFGSKPEETGPRHVLVLIDRSLSMEFRDSGLTGRQRGALELEKIIGTLGANDLLNIYAVGRDAAACFNGLSTDHSEALRFVRGLEPGLGRADFNKACAAAAKELESVSGRQEVYFISDFQRTTWAEADLGRLPPSARLFFVNVAAKERPNRALLGAQFPPGGSTLEVKLGNFAPEAWHGEVEAIMDGKTSAKAEASLGPWLTGKVMLALPPGGPGLHSIEVRLPEDDLPQDDHYFLSLQTAEQEEVLVVTDETGGHQQSAGFFLTKALNPFENHGGTILPKSGSSAALSPERLATTKKVFLTTLDRLSSAACQLLAKFVTGGGSLVYFCDGKFDGENLRDLDKAAGGEFSPLRLAERQEAGRSASAQQILHGDWKSRYLRLFSGTQRQNLALMEFYDYYHALPAKGGSVLLTFADGSPAMAASHPALGTVLLCNFSVNELASNLARQRAFPAWIQDLVKTLDSEEAPEKPIEAGEEVHADLWQADLKSNAVRAPDGRTVRTVRELEGDRCHLSFLAEQQGVYRLEESGAPIAFAVNLPPEESDLRTMDLDLLSRRLGDNQQAHFVEGRADFEALNAGHPLFHYFLFGVLALLLAEGAVQLLVRPAGRTPSP